MAWEFQGNSAIALPPAFFGNILMGTPTVADVWGPGLSPDGKDDLIFAGAGCWGPMEHTDPIFCLGHWVENDLVVVYWNGFAWTEVGRSFLGVNQCPTEMTAGVIGISTPAVGDVTHDGVPDVLVLLPGIGIEFQGPFPAVLRVYDPTVGFAEPVYELQVPLGELLTEDDGPLEERDLSCLVLADRNLDGHLEAIFPYKGYGPQAGSHFVAVVSFLGTPGITSFPLPDNYVISFVEPVPLLAVADGPSDDAGLEGGLDIYVPTRQYAGANYVATHFLLFRPSTILPFPTPENRRFDWPKSFVSSASWEYHAHAPIVANTMGEDGLEFTCQIGGPNQSQHIWHLKLDNRQGGSDQEWPVAGTCFEQQTRLCAGAISDVDGNGLTELVQVVPTSATQATIHAYELQSPPTPDLVEWSQFQNGPRHTGLYAQPVTGEQPRAEMKWSGRIIVHDEYLVPPNHLLTIEPGTVVEFRPGASLTIEGTLIAQGSGVDSIYFKPDVSESWGPINIGLTGSATLAACVFDGGGIFAYAGSLVLEGCRFHDADVALDLLKAYPLINGNTIHHCDYGIRGTQSAGLLANNIIHSCTRAGIYWVGDIPETGEAALFSSNVIEANGSDPNDAIAGGYFNNTTARLECNQFLKNRVNQILCEGYGDVVMKTRPF